MQTNESTTIFMLNGGIDALSIVARVFLTMICAGIIGVERGRANQAAGMRTYMLVSLGAAIVMMTGQCLYATHETGDPARLGAQVVSGIGFLGAGSIIVSGKTKIRGLTTAAGLWVSACIGLSIGSGFMAVGVISTLAVVAIMTVMKRVEDFFSNQFCVYMELKDTLSLESISDELKKEHLYISGIKMSELGCGKQKLILGIRCETHHQNVQVLAMLRSIEGVQYAEFVA